jgi:hypothetical protein
MELSLRSRGLMVDGFITFHRGNGKKLKTLNKWEINSKKKFTTSNHDKN